MPNVGGMQGNRTGPARVVGSQGENAPWSGATSCEAVLCQPAVMLTLGMDWRRPDLPVMAGPDPAICPRSMVRRWPGQARPAMTVGGGRTVAGGVRTVGGRCTDGERTGARWILHQRHRPYRTSGRAFELRG